MTDEAAASRFLICNDRGSAVADCAPVAMILDRVAMTVRWPLEQLQ
jgi:hypothetical protein